MRNPFCKECKSIDPLDGNCGNHGHQEFPYCRDCTPQEICPHHKFLKLPKEYVGIGEHQHRYTVVVSWRMTGDTPNTPGNWASLLINGGGLTGISATKILCESCLDVKEVNQ